MASSRYPIHLYRELVGTILPALAMAGKPKCVRCIVEEGIRMALAKYRRKIARRKRRKRP